MASSPAVKPKPKPSPSPSASPSPLSDADYAKKMADALRANQTEVPISSEGTERFVSGAEGRPELVERKTMSMPGEAAAQAAALRKPGPSPSPSPSPSPGSDFMHMPMSELKGLMSTNPEAVRAYMERMSKGEK